MKRCIVRTILVLVIVLLGGAANHLLQRRGRITAYSTPKSAPAKIQKYFSRILIN